MILKTILIAMSPILELRGAIPIAYGDMSIYSAFIWSVIGNMIPVILLLLFLEPVSRFLRKIPLFDKIISWVFEKTRARHEKKFERWEKFALIALVAIPLPFTGAWTGSICAFLFNIKFKESFPLILSGVLIAGIIVSIITISI